MGMALFQVNSMTRLRSFEPIPQLGPLISLPEDTLKDMSTGSAVCFRLVRAAACGLLEPELANRLVGSLSHFRWITTCQSFLLLCMSADNDLDREQKRTLHLIAKWVAHVYFQCRYPVPCGSWSAPSAHTFQTPQTARSRCERGRDTLRQI